MDLLYPPNFAERLKHNGMGCRDIDSRCPQCFIWIVIGHPRSNLCQTGQLYTLGSAISDISIRRELGGRYLTYSMILSVMNTESSPYNYRIRSNTTSLTLSSMIRGRALLYGCPADGIANS